MTLPMGSAVSPPQRAGQSVEQRADAEPHVQGCAIQLSGQVQGVGFRPFVYQLAQSLGLAGDVCNDASGVRIRVWGTAAGLAEFDRRLLTQLPPMALIESVRRQTLLGRPETESFQIIASQAGAVQVGVTPDATVCPACLDELFDTTDRRYRYPFINCTHCGPRYSLIQQLPYDRPHTTMAPFTLCAACQREYQNPGDRRFHAQPNACPDCGPRLRLHASAGPLIDAQDPIAETLKRIQQGQIVAIKGIGGFHLVCDARNDQAVALLRQRKRRYHKPFALMAANPASLECWVKLNPLRIQQLRSSVAPIVLCPALNPDLLPGIAPKLAWIGVMLPHSPLHYLLFHQAAGRPEGSSWLNQANALVLVMTSANPSGDPLVTDNDEAFKRLGGLADAILLHDREIHIRCDDSVVHGGSDIYSQALLQQRATGRIVPPALVRRGRGLAPQVIALPAAWADAPSVLATGALLKNTVCLTKGNRAYVSQHIGDLDNPNCCRALEQTVAHLCRLFEIKPQWVVHDLHPDNFASQFGQRFAQQHGLPVLTVQHHHAHIAAVLAEHSAAGMGENSAAGMGENSTVGMGEHSAAGMGEHSAAGMGENSAAAMGENSAAVQPPLQLGTLPVLGLALDGFGLGQDGTGWGGELLRLEGGGYQRLAQFTPLPLPGGDRAATQPWRMAAATLHLLGRTDEIQQRFADQPGASTVMQMLRGGVNCPATSSAGRLFDAAAGILGIQPVADYEAQPAMMLEGLAQRYLESIQGAAWHWQDEPRLIYITEAGDLDTLPLLERLLQHHDQGLAVGYSAALLHVQLIDALVRWVEQHNRQQQLDTLVLGGGCFLNQLLSDGIEQRLQQQGLTVLRAAKLPCNDGGLSLGQAWVALSMIHAKG